MVSPRHFGIGDYLQVLSQYIYRSTQLLASWSIPLSDLLCTRPNTDCIVDKEENTIGLYFAPACTGYIPIFLCLVEWQCFQ